ncbi:MAG: Hint domain-containing protein [Pseudomonadota bacterium]
MPMFAFNVFEVDSTYYYGDAQSPILSKDTLTIDDDDTTLHRTNTADPGTNQQFDFAAEPDVSTYDVQYLDFAQVEGGGPEYELYTMEVQFTDGTTKYYVMSKDENFDPEIGDDLQVTTFSTFTTTDYGSIGALVCFTPGTLILTSTGERAIEALEVGDLVETLDHGPQAIRWIGARTLTARELIANPKLRPIRIEKQIFGNRRPLLVSPQHRMLVNAADLNWTDGPSHGLIRAKHVKDHLGGAARIAWGKRSVTYIHLLFDRHEIIWAEGAATESLYPGPMALAGMESDAAGEIRALFPEISRLCAVDSTPSRFEMARPIVPNHVVERFSADLKRRRQSCRNLRLSAQARPKPTQEVSVA